MEDRPIKEMLKASLDAEPEHNGNVVDLNMERMERRFLNATEVKPQELIKLVLRDMGERYQNVVKCYVTLVIDAGDSFTVSNYRAGLTRSEEVAFRSLGLQEAMDNWRFGGE